MKFAKALFWLSLFCACKMVEAQNSFKILVIASADKDHVKMIVAAKPFFDSIASKNNFTVIFTKDTSILNDTNLANFNAVVQLQLAPFDMSTKQQDALQKYISNGKGWVGIHAAGLTGRQFIGSGSRYWDWFESFMGGVTYSPHPKLQKGRLIIEDRNHPVTRNLPANFEITDEWYEWNHSPRTSVHVLASADESSYLQNKSMGDYPMIWLNEKYPKTVYICTGHDPSDCSNPNYAILIRDAILWAAGVSQ